MMPRTTFFRIFLILFLLTGVINRISAQSKEHIDSLIEQVKRTPDDTTKLQYLNELVDIAPDGTWQLYNEQMRTLSNKLMGNVSTNKAAKKYLAVSDNNSATDLGEKGDYKKALSYLIDCIKIQEELGNKKDLALALNNTGAIYDRDGDHDKALENYYRAIKLEEDTAVNDFTDLVSTLTNVGRIFFDKNSYDSALIYFEKGLVVVEKHKIKSLDNVTALYKDLGNLMEKKGNLEQALEYYSKGLKVADDGGYKIGQSINLLGMADVYFDKNEIAKSLGYAQKAFALAIKTDNLKNIIGASNLLTKIYKKQGNFKDALGMYELAIKTRDSLFSADNHKASVRTQFQVEFNKKQDSTKAEQAKIDAVKATELQNRKRIRNFTLGGMVIVVFFLILVFRQRNKIAKEKHRSEELLLNILPEEVAQELKDTGGAKVKSFESVTVLFTDFKGFTQISEKLTPEELVAEIDYCFRGFDNIIHKHGIEKIKTIGDSYMCAGGVPKANFTHAEDVVNAAIEIRDFILKHKQEKIARGEIPFEIRIGVHTGPVVAGIVGTKKFAYDIWGDAVNTASRMESSGEAGKVNISGITFELIKDKFNCLHRGKIMAKGKGDIDMYFVELKS